MDKDRAAICEIMSEMLDNPDDCGIYPTTVAYNKLETLVHTARVEAIGWTHADACHDLDAGRDPRQKEVSEMLERAISGIAGLNQPLFGSFSVQTQPNMKR
jgi:hypothetical protein